MRLSERERKMLVLLAFLVIWVFGVRALIMPQQAMKREYLATLQELSVKRDEMERSFKLKEQLMTAADSAQAMDDTASFFYRNLDPIDVDRVLQQLAEQHGIELVSMEIAADAARFKQTDDMEKENMVIGAESESDPEKPGYISEVTTVSLVIRGKAADVMYLADAVNQLNNSIVVSGLDVEAQAAGQEMEGRMTILFFGLVD